jgi:hypothetical protein
MAVDEADVRARRREGRGPAELECVTQPAQTAGGKILNASDRPVWAAALSGQFDVYRDGIDTAEDAAYVAAAGQLACVVHELFEWTTLDGVRLADPHPPGDAQWDWVLDRCLDLLTEYAARWPVGSERGAGAAGPADEVDDDGADEERDADPEEDRGAFEEESEGAEDDRDNDQGHCK